MSQARRLAWLTGYQVLRVLIGLPANFAVAFWDGLGGFRRSFSETWGQRARVGDGPYWWGINQRRKKRQQDS